MEIGELWIDPADGLLMIYMGLDPDQHNHYAFYCPTAFAHQEYYYYSNYDLKYLRRIE